jgi:hypothetical protein
MDSCNFAAFLNHALGICGGRFHLAADWPIHNGGDFLDNLIEIPALFCNQRRICRYAANNAHIICFTDIFYIRCINKKFHNLSSLSDLSNPMKQYPLQDCQASLQGIRL